MPNKVLQFRVFISSPGDVLDERNLARQLLSDELPRVPAFRQRVSFDPISWDDPAARVVMLAGEQPQDSVNRSLPRPAECDFVVIILWSRMGTPLPDTVRKSNGEPYVSGTEWEFEDAMTSSKRPSVMVYHRTEKQKVNLDDPDIDAKREQLKKVDRFLSRFRNPDGSISSGINSYSTPSEFKEQLRQHLEQLVWERIKDSLPQTEMDEARPGWEGSPFPGLRAFTTADAPIFFGRGLETDTLISKLGEHRFVAVIGASGSGKSSIIGAGLIPRLQKGALPGSQSWHVPYYSTEFKQWIGLRFTPGELGENPFLSLSAKLAPLVQRPAVEIAQRIEAEPDALVGYIDLLSPEGRRDRSTLMFIDQFEELFTVCDKPHQTHFARLLESCYGQQNMYVVLTLRADYYHYCLDISPLSRLLGESSFPLPPPTDMLLEMILRPAELATLEFEEGLAGQILQATGREPGALALLAYTLDELYQRCRHTRRITRAAYDELGGVQGAIGSRAEQAYSELGAVDPGVFGRVFGDLVSVDEAGSATRRRAKLQSFSGDSQAMRLIAAFTNERLLTTSDEHLPSVEVAHEAIFRHWERLAQWIRHEQEDLILLRQVREAAAFWENKGRSDAYLWSGGRLREAREMIARKNPILSEGEREFLRSEVERLMKIINDSSTDDFRRAEIGDRLAMIGDTRFGVGLMPNNIPDIEWCRVGNNADAFLISKYPITYLQYRSFVEASVVSERRSSISMHQQFRKTENCPAENVSFNEAENFCRWLASRIGYEVRLPTQEEWKQAAHGPHPDFNYPWGTEWAPGHANTAESRLSRTTAVGMYPQGAAECGACDMSGNVWEWTATKGAHDDDHVICGGSWLTGAELATITSARSRRDTNRGNNVGFRIVAIRG